MTFCTVGRKLLRNVIRVCCLCEIVVVATVTGIGCIVVITIVAGSTVVGDSRMSPEQLIEIIVYGECSRRPARICSVTRFTGNRQIERNVIRIDTLVVVGLVTCCAGIGCIVVIALMTVIAGGGQVCAREWPVAVTECGWYPGILSVALFTAQRELLCLVIRIGGIVVIIRMTTGTGIGCIVVVAVMTCCTVVGNSRVRSGQLIEVVVYRECGRRPARIGSVAGFTGGRQIERRVVRIDALVVVCSMAACTGIGRVTVVSLMAVVTGCTRMGTRERPETVIECRRRPGILRMAVSTGSRELLCSVIRVGCVVVVVSVAACTGIGRIAVVALVTVIATDTGMRSHYQIERVIQCSRSPCSLIVAVCAVHRKLLCHVIWVCCGIKVVGMAAGTGVGGIIVVSVMTGSAVVGDGRMCSGQLVEIVVKRERSRRPSRTGGMACFTTRGQVQRYVARIDALCVVIGVTTGAGIGCIVVIALVTLVAGHSRMRTREWPVVVVKTGWCPRCLPVTIRTICGK